jgi:hypothetical protein
MLESIIVGKENAQLICKSVKYKYVFIFNEGFCHEGEAGTFFYSTHICVL